MRPDELGDPVGAADGAEQRPATPQQLDGLHGLIGSWLRESRQANPAIAAVEPGPVGERRWYVRLNGEEKNVWTIWFRLGQRTLHYETYLVPAPEENQARFYEYLLRLNRRLTGLKLEIGVEDAVFLAGTMPVDQVSAPALDRVLGSMYAAVELIFRPAMRIGFASRFKG